MAISPATYLRRNKHDTVSYMERYIDARLNPDYNVLNKATNNIEISFPHLSPLDEIDEQDLINRYKNAGWKFVTLSCVITNKKTDYCMYTIHLR